MKAAYIFQVIAVAHGLVAGAAGLVAAEPTGTGHAPPPEPGGSPNMSEMDLLEAYGWMAGMRAGLSRLDLGEEELIAFQRGIAAARAGKDLEGDMSVIGPAVSRLVQLKFDAHMAELKARQVAAAEAFWEDLAEDESVTISSSGLAYKIVSPGTDPKPRPNDTVRAHYTGRLIDGTVFDSSEGGGPFETKLNQVIEGWTQGLGLIGAGGAIELYIPASLGYGDDGTGDIPPGATLIFEVELLEVITDS